MCDSFILRDYDGYIDEAYATVVAQGFVHVVEYDGDDLDAAEVWLETAGADYGRALNVFGFANAAVAKAFAFRFNRAALSAPRHAEAAKPGCRWPWTPARDTVALAA